MVAPPATESQAEAATSGSVPDEPYVLATVPLMVILSKVSPKLTAKVGQEIVETLFVVILNPRSGPSQSL